MSRKEKEIVKTIAAALPEMDDFSKGYLLGQAELMARQKTQKEQEEKKIEGEVVQSVPHTLHRKGRC